MAYAGFAATPGVRILVRSKVNCSLTGIMLKITAYNTASPPIRSAFFESHITISSSKKEDDYELLVYSMVG